jgi:hypothetical protein
MATVSDRKKLLLFLSCSVCERHLNTEREAIRICGSLNVPLIAARVLAQDKGRLTGKSRRKAKWVG